MPRAVGPTRISRSTLRSFTQPIASDYIVFVRRRQIWRLRKRIIIYGDHIPSSCGIMSQLCCGWAKPWLDLGSVPYFRSTLKKLIAQLLCWECSRTPTDRRRKSVLNKNEIKQNMPKINTEETKLYTTKANTGKIAKTEKANLNLKKTSN